MNALMTVALVAIVVITTIVIFLFVVAWTLSVLEWAREQRQ